jgi:enamine deaminase RidA (YjgF/YER057c/UK114 family)
MTTLGHDGSPFRASARVGDLILLIGMIGRDREGHIPEGIAAQTELALKRCEEVLAERSLGRTDIVRVRAFVTDVREWPQAREVIVDFFDGDVPPAMAAAVTGLVVPEVKIELELDASAEGVE